jgi:putative zinc finger/helix-turn-helix YgiT family protein
MKKFTDVQVRIPNLEGDAVAETHTVRVPITIDPNTGEELLTEEAVQMIETAKARYMGLLLPEEIRALRQRLELTQKQMSELLQAGEKSYTRWESGKARPSRMVNVLLRLLYEGRVSVEAIRQVGRAKTGGVGSHEPFESAVYDWSKAAEWNVGHAKFFGGAIQHVLALVESKPRLISLKHAGSDYERQKNSRSHREKFKQSLDETFPTSA